MDHDTVGTLKFLGDNCGWKEEGMLTGSSNTTSTVSRRLRYRGVLEANSTANIAHFTCATPMLDTP